MKVGLQFKAAEYPEVLEVLKQDNLRVSFDNTNLYIKKTTDSVKSYTLVNDVFNNSKIIMILEAKRTMYQTGLAIIQYTSVAFIISSLIIAGLCFLVLEVLVIRRIEKLDGFMNSVKNRKKLSTKIFLPGNDEISNLATSANNMLRELDSYYKEIETNQERFKLIMEATNDGYFDSNLLRNRIYINPDWLIYLGYVNSDSYLTYDQILTTIHPEDAELFRTTLSNCLTGNTAMLYVEYRTCKNSGEWVWVQVRGKIVEYDDLMNPRRIIGTISDITQRKTYEAENLYLSQTDVVTTLKNRTFAEDLLEKAEKCVLCKSWIILGDVNGLKLINDTFGHQEGDRLGDVLTRIVSIQI